MLRPLMFTEPVVIEIPGFAPLVAMVGVSPDDHDRAVAARVAPLFPPGTVLHIAGGEWVINRSVPLVVSRRTLRPGQVPQPVRRSSGVRPSVDCPKTGRRRSGS